MPTLLHRRPWPAHLVAAALLALLVPTINAARPDPLDPQAAVPRLTHESAFKHYRGQRDEKLRGWKDANDEVGRIGGWRAYAREAQQADAPASQPPAASSAPARGASSPPAKPAPQAPQSPLGAGHQHH
jgi:hypothetical protein